jgi:hypothetical protein
MFKKAFRITLGLIGVLFAFVIFQAIRPPEALVVSPSTTVITTPLHSDGTPHYGKHLLSQWREGVTPENNGAVSFWKAFWPSNLSPENQVAIQRELEFTADPNKPPFRIASRELWDEVRRTVVEKSVDDETGMMSAMDDNSRSSMDTASTIQNAITDQPWTRAELPMVADWIDRHTEDYEWLRQSSSAERFYSPPTMLLADPDASLVDALVDMGVLRPVYDASDNLSAKIMMQIGEKQFATAWDDCLTGLRFSDQIPDTGFLSRLTQIAVRSAMFRASNELLSANLPKDLVLQITRDFESFRWDREMANSIDTLERMAALDLAVCVRSSEESSDERPAQYVTFYNRFVNRNVVVDHINGFYDDMVKSLQADTYQERQQLARACEERLRTERQAVLSNLAKSVFSRSARSKLLCDTYVDLLMPAIAAVTSAEDRILMEEKFTRLHVKLANYRLEHGEYPSDLNQLTEDKTNDAIEDPVFGGKIKYRRTNDGFLLYSLGSDQQDHSGSNAQMQKWQGWDLSDNDPSFSKYIAKMSGEHIDVQSTIDTDELITPPIPKDADDLSLRIHGYRKDLSEASKSLRELDVKLP